MKTSHILSALSLVAILSSSALAKDLNLPVVSKGYQHEFWQTVKMGTEAAAKELGDKTSYVGPADETQIAEQIQLVENTMAQKPNGLLLAALDANALARWSKPPTAGDQSGDLRLGRELRYPGQLCRHQ